ncbi:MAG: hypothetical protein ACTSYI_10365 [Promethearchaeota archaeon]
MTLKDICFTFHKTKVTIINHLKELKEIGMLNMREEVIRGPLVRKYYSVDPRSFRETIVKCEDFESLSSKDKWHYLSEKAQYDRFQYEFLRTLLDQIIPYLDHLREDILNYSKAGMEYKELAYEQKKGKIFFYPLNEDEYEIYIEETMSMMGRIAEKFAEVSTPLHYNFINTSSTSSGLKTTLLFWGKAGKTFPSCTISS